MSASPWRSACAEHQRLQVRGVSSRSIILNYQSHSRSTLWQSGSQMDTNQNVCVCVCAGRVGTHINSSTFVSCWGVNYCTTTYWAAGQTDTQVYATFEGRDGHNPAPSTSASPSEIYP